MILNTEYEKELSSVLGLYDLNIDRIIENKETDNVSIEYYVKIPSYWFDAHIQEIYGLVCSYMNNYCNENDLWDSLLRNIIIFE